MNIIQYPANAEGCLLRDHLMNIMAITRERTHKISAKLTQFDLDYKVHGFVNTVGTLLKHIAALETWYCTLIFEGRGFTEAEDETWRGAMPGQLYLELIRGHELGYYKELLDQSRQKLFRELAAKDDKWLFENLLHSTLPFGNNYTGLFHLVEDELSHQGQMKSFIKFLNK
jgi:uncharacterized damage-inducible protein DinB